LLHTISTDARLTLRREARGRLRLAGSTLQFVRAGALQHYDSLTIQSQCAENESRKRLRVTKNTVRP